MISALPLLTEADVELQHGKLALAFLTTVSTAMAENAARNNLQNNRNFQKQIKNLEYLEELEKETASVISDAESSSSYSTAEEDHFYDGGAGHVNVNVPLERMDTQFQLLDYPEVIIPTRSESSSMSSTDYHVEDSMLPLQKRVPSPPTMTPADRAAYPDPTRRPYALGSEVQKILGSGQPFTAAHLQQIFNCFKVNELGAYDCELLLDLLLSSQAREDFQWALHQLGGFNATLFLYGRVSEVSLVSSVGAEQTVLEISTEDSIQAKGLTLALVQLKVHSKITDSPVATKYQLLRFLLNTSKSTFGFKTFILLANQCLNPKGNRLEDYDLLHICIVSSWRKLLRIRVTEADAPTGDKTLFECLLIILLDLCVEKNPHRDVNVGTLRAHRFAETLLAICNSTLGEAGTANLGIIDALKIASYVKSILIELMAPPDATVAVALVQFGLLPFLPRDLPPLPRKQDAFFVYQGNATDSNMNLTPVNEQGDVSEEENSLNVQIPVEEDSGLRMRIDQSTCPPTPQKLDNSGTELQNFTDAFTAAILEAVMSILLNSLSILSDETFRTVLSPHLSTHIFVAYCSHPSSTLKALALKLLAAYLARLKNPAVTEFVKNRGFCLTSLYTQANPELASSVLDFCTSYGPVSYSLLTALIYSKTVVNNLIQWIQHDEAGVASALLSMGLLPSVLNFYRSSQQLPRGLIALLSLVTKYSVLNPKDDPWKVLFCPGIESAPQHNFISARLIQDAFEMLRKYTGKDLKKSDASSRLLWLIERSAGIRTGHQFDKWLLNVFTRHFAEIDEDEESEVWKYFLKKNRRRLTYLFGVFLCRIFAPNKGDLDFKQYTLRVLVLSCPNLGIWLPKVIRSEEAVERCFTAFTRVFMSEAESRGVNSAGRIRSPSFQSVVSSNGNLILTLQTAAAVGLPNNLSEGQNDSMHLSERAIRSKFGAMLIEAGILSPTNNFNNSTASLSGDFKTFQILLDATPISGVSYHELRQCLATVEKMRNSILKSSSTLKKNSTVATIKLNNSPGAISVFQISNSASYFESVFESVHTFAIEVLDVVTRMRTRQEIDVARRISVRDEDIFAKEKLWHLRERLVHPKAPWYFPESYPKFWALDQTEGPGRLRIRLHKDPLKVHSRFVKGANRGNEIEPQPLEYLFKSDSHEFLNYPVIQSEIQFIRFCIRIIPGEELPGEIILSLDSLHFFCETCHVTQDHCAKVSVPRSSIYQVLRRRYTLEDRAAEIFVDSQSYLLVFRTQRDREEFISTLTNRIGVIPAHSNTVTNNSILMNSSLSTMTAQWVKGTLSNFDYLMYLNTAAGRTYCDLMQYPVFPFVLSKYDCPTLDLYSPPSYRDLKRPMAIQDPAKEEHFVSTYNYLKRECDSTPFHYGSHYSNSGTVLHFLVRLPPYTQHFLKYQDGSFDIPDRSFHSVETTWRLASRESNTDFKEAIPEFFYLPEFLQNLQNFDLGVRQNGTRVDDVNLPAWAKGNPRLFTLINRQALESQQVRKYLGDWIDLVFGYKQTGKAAIQSLNVFHPSTYEGFDVEGEGTDDLVRKARKAMVSTYGQTPKKLFAFPHPRPQIQPNEACEQEAVDTVWGIRWGQYLGSPASPDLDVFNTREYREPVSLFETSSRIVFWPKNTLILGDAVVGTWDSTGIRIKSNVVHLCIGDEITACSGIDNTLWVGYQSGRISVLKLTPTQDKVVETIELVGHYKPIKHIDMNQEFSIAVSCSGENYALVWDMNRLAFTNVIDHDEPIDFIYSSKSTGDILLLSKESNTVTLKTINGFLIGKVQPEEQIESACLSGLDPGRNVNVLAVGCDYGIIKFYSTWDLRCVNQIKVLPLSTLAIKSIRYSRDGRRLYCMSQTENTFVTVALQLAEVTSRP